MAKYFFRLDDVAPNMNWDSFNSLIAVFKKHNIKPLIAVIPDNKDAELLRYPYNPDFWDIINRLNGDGWIIAQHGYRHFYKTKDGGILGINKMGEFSGLDFEAQKQMIKNGRYIMKEKVCEPKIFIAPGHSFDRNTIRVLKENGYNCISDGIALYPFKKWGVVWLPQILWRPRKFPFGLITAALHPNTMTDKDFNNLEKFIEKNHEKIGNFSELTNWYLNAGVLKKFFTYIINLIFRPIWRLAFILKHGLSR